jgi:hypothetical protein
MSDMDEKAILSVQVPAAQRDGLAHLAASHDRSISAEMRRAIALHLHLSEHLERSSGFSAVPDDNPAAGRAQSAAESRPSAGTER